MVRVHKQLPNRDKWNWSYLLSKAQDLYMSSGLFYEENF